MCLKTVEPVKHRVLKGRNIGYKVFYENKHASELSGPYYGEGYKIGKWYQDQKNYVLFADDNQLYDTGFHIFTSLKGAKQYNQGEGGVICLVNFQDIVATGKHEAGRDKEFNIRQSNCVVAKRMRIIKKLK